MDTEKVIERLMALATSSSKRSKAAQLEAVMPGIESAMASGVSRADIVKSLSESGLEMTLHYFDTALNRIRKKRKTTQQNQRVPVQKPSLATPQETYIKPEARPNNDQVNEDTGDEPDNQQTIFDPSDLRALLNKKVDLASLSQLGKELNRKRKKDENSRN
jgi:hypothetical protein